MKLKKYISGFFLCLVISLSCNAQSNGNAILLKEILAQMGKQHKVNFNYIEDEIAFFKLIPPNKKLTLVEKMDYITEKTQLEFTIVTATYISVSNNKKLDKPLCGYLVDSETNQPIPFATVRIKETSFSTISNQNGYFELQKKSSNQIEITHVNYEKIVLAPLDLYKEKCPTIKLKIVHYQLDEVQTEVYLTKGISKKTNGTFEIKPKKFGLLPGLTEPDVFQTMQQLPGITSVDETISNINVRGGTHDQNLFLWNGIRLFQTGHFYGLISVLNPNLAQKINISKNGSSAFFSESISSVIDISTISKSKDTTSSFGLNMINFDFNTTLKTSKNSSLQLSARRSLTDVVSSPTYRSYYNRIFQNTIVTNLSGNQDIKYNSDVSFYFYDATATFNQKIKEKTNVALSLITISNQLDVDQNKTENNTTIYRDNSLKQQSIAGSLTVDTKWNETNSSKIIAYGSFYKVLSESQSLEGTQISNQENKVLDTNILIRNSHVLNKNFTFNNGYQFNEIGIQNFDTVNSPQFSRTLKDVLHNHALIGELNYEPEKRNFYASFGIRQNYFSQFNRFITEPRLQFNYRISSVFQLELLAEAKNQTTSQIIDLQKDFLGIEKRRWMLANNQDIPIIKSNQASLGFTFKKKNWLITLDNFYKKATGITSQSQNFQNQLEFVKTNGDYTIWGSEILIQKQFYRFISWVTYTYTNNNYSFEDYNPSKFSNNFENKHQVNFGLIYDHKNLKIALGGHWFTGKPTTLPLNNTISNGAIVFESPNSSRLDDYLQLNLSAGHTLDITKKVKLQFGASLQNILNKKNTINQYFRINQSSNTIEKINTYSIERTPNVFLRLIF